MPSFFVVILKLSRSSFISRDSISSLLEKALLMFSERNLAELTNRMANTTIRQIDISG
jgi:hypothetical protein